MPKRDLQLARKAFKNKNVYDTVKAHLLNKVDDMPQKENHTFEIYIGSLIRSGLDGIISTFVIVAGVTGASLSTDILLILGFTILLAFGLFKAIGDFLNTKARLAFHRREREREKWEIETYPDGEIREMIDIYTEIGISQPDANDMVNIIKKYKDAWAEIMMVEELGLVKIRKSPLKNAVVTFLSFSFIGIIPLLAYIFSNYHTYLLHNTLLVTTIISGIALFLLGSLKVFTTAKNWLLSGLEVLFLGGLAGALAYALGLLLSRLV